MLLLSIPANAAPPLSGAIFTTTVDGDVVNGNVIYDAKTDVYLDGGPGPNAPSTAAGLPDGSYHYQVTDPSGKTLLSTDPVRCRRFDVTGGTLNNHTFAVLLDSGHFGVKKNLAVSFADDLSQSSADPDKINNARSRNVNGPNPCRMRFQFAKPCPVDDFAIDPVGLSPFVDTFEIRELCFLDSDNHFPTDIVGNAFFLAEGFHCFFAFTAIGRFE